MSEDVHKDIYADNQPVPGGGQLPTPADTQNRVVAAVIEERNELRVRCRELEEALNRIYCQADGHADKVVCLWRLENIKKASAAALEPKPQEETE